MSHRSAKKTPKKTPVCMGALPEETFGGNIDVPSLRTYSFEDSGLWVEEATSASGSRRGEGEGGKVRMKHF